ncbi:MULTISPECIES: YczE/YyaS/YitT family protein [Pontibacillus]|uniref:YitT family protein n=1 Tax=Pontibacillus chungwhensis TaxID=265426 RepID=A0ABY8V7I6_9BACI|nr:MULTISPECIES: hypothetical protein [Pontibacillus]MCD5322536.1 hypothetical protein [Pontibacillus sp. HN14]WIF99821.1 hypothetical protein QNI29_09225 [Pontibacillus chungwhensis]
MTLGISLTIIADLGTMPFDSLNVGLSEAVGLSTGSWEIINGFLLVCLNAFLLREKPDLLALGTAVVTGIGIDFWLSGVFSNLEVSHGLTAYVLLIIGILLLGLGVAMYVRSHFAYNPVDGAMMVVHKLTGFSLGMSKTIVSLVLLVISILIGGPVGVGTGIAILLIGPTVNVSEKALNRFTKAQVTSDV